MIDPHVAITEPCPICKRRRFAIRYSRSGWFDTTLPPTCTDSSSCKRELEDMCLTDWKRRASV